MGFLFNTIYAIAEALAPLDNLGAAASFDSFINEAQRFNTLHFIACRLEIWGDTGNVYTQREVK